MGEAAEHMSLPGERLDDPDPGDALLGARCHLSDPLLHLLLGGPVPAAVARGGRDQERHRRQREQGKDGIEDEHRDGREQDRQSTLAHPDQPVAQEEPDRLQVDRRARHQLPRLLGVEEPELQLLQVLVEGLAQVELDRQRDLPGDQPATHRQQQPQDPGPEQGEDERHDVVAVLGLDRVDRRAREQRDQHRHPHRHPGEQQRADQLAAIRTQEAEQAPKGGHTPTIQSEVLVSLA
jgi:hypothetical protein